MGDPVNVGYAAMSLIGSDAAARRRAVAAVEASGLDHLTMIDHVSFRTGFGVDGLTYASSVLALTDRLRVATGAYLLALRNPVTVARQVSDLAQLGPGRLVFGVGVGGEDRREIEICGIDPRTRGRRTDECIQVVRGLLSGQPFDFEGEFFSMEGAVVAPAADDVPIVVGGRSDAALRRAGRLGDGWLGVWVSPRRYAEVLDVVDGHAADVDRGEVDWRHALCVYCGTGPDRDTARTRVAAAMEGLYGIPFESFERWCPSGSADEIAGFLAPYVEAGCRDIHLFIIGNDTDEEIAAAAEIRQLLTT
jgi:alkanesulfonate monooxygenase SsuD/methylene tetrahydromethanopterin reductase-like flavin-dependent oxidoreductase (luciferase family)